MVRLAGVALFALAVCAQNGPLAQNGELARVAKNPYELARFVDSHLGFDWNVLWKALGTEPVFIQPCGKLTGGLEHCSTELISVHDPDQVILLLIGDATPADVYLRFFHEKDGSWRFAGTYQAEVRYHPRRHEVDRSTGTPFLRVSCTGNHGSHVDSEEEQWLDLTQPKFEPVFSFPVQGYLRGFQYDIARRLTSTIVAGKDGIEVILEVHFWALNVLDGPEFDLGTLRLSGVYKRAPGAVSFDLQSVHGLSPGGAEVLPADFEAIVTLWEGPSNEDLVRVDMVELRTIASGKETATKQWLRQFVNRLKDTAEVRELKMLLR